MTIGGFRKVWTRKLAVALGDFLSELHSLRISRSELKGVPLYTPKEWLRQRRLLHRRIKRIVYPLLDRDTRRQTEAFWEEQLEDFKDITFDPTLIHGDLTSRNILFDPTKQELTGILDWSDTLFGDPAYDFAGLYKINPSLGEKTLQEYRREKSGFTSRIPWYVDTMPFHEIIWGVTQNSEEYTNQGLTHLSRMIVRS